MKVDNLADIHLECATRSPMCSVLACADRHALGDGGLLLVGEFGTGMEALARRVHARSGRGGALAVVRCGAFDEQSLLHELFGAGGPGAGAGSAFTRARSGTLFLEDIQTMPPSVQTELVRRLEDARRDDAGGQTAPRLVATSPTRLFPAVWTGSFRRDLHDAFGITLELPPLRSRPDDIAPLVRRLWARHGRRDPLPEDVLAVLQAHPWPGNVLELESFTARLAFTCDRGRLSPVAIRAQLEPGAPAAAARRAAPDAGEGSAGREREPAGSETVLVVDDDRVVRSVTARVLRRAGYDVVEAETAGEALRIAEGRALDLLLSDVIMPGMSGPELVARVRTLRPESRALLMSGFGPAAVGREHGPVTPFLEKPFTPTTLVDAVRRVLARARAA